MYTKGPWKAREVTERSITGEMKYTYISANKGWANSGMAGERTIASVGHWTDRPNPEDDARLIAAAPELLEALELSLEWLDSVCEPNCEIAIPAGMEAREKIIAAIEKATNNE